MKRVLLLVAVYFVSSMIFMSCATTSLTSTWRDPGFQPSVPQKAVVIAVLNNDGVRRRVEDTFVKQLLKEQVTGVPSYSFMQNQKMDNETISEEVSRLGADLIIVTTLVDRKTTETYVPPTASTTRMSNPGFYGYYSSRVDTTFTPGYTVTSESAISELKAFDAKDQKLIWSATASTSLDGGVSDATIDEFCKKATENLLKGREIKKG